MVLVTFVGRHRRRCSGSHVHCDVTGFHRTDNRHLIVFVIGGVQLWRTAAAATVHTARVTFTATDRSTAECRATDSDETPGDTDDRHGQFVQCNASVFLQRKID